MLERPLAELQEMQPNKKAKKVAESVKQLNDDPYFSAVFVRTLGDIQVPAASPVAAPGVRVSVLVDAALGLIGGGG
eukprot:1619618-Pyramimonas_sp.AAC.1